MGKYYNMLTKSKKFLMLGKSVKNAILPS